MSRDGETALARLVPPRPGTPAYRQIEEQLLDLIAEGALAPGDRMPAERDLALRLGVSRMTLRQALDALVRRGLLVRAGGRGTFVADAKVEHDLRILRTYPEELRTQGRAPETAVLDARVVPASPRVAAALARTPGTPVHRVVRLRAADGVPIVLETAWVPVDLAPGLTARDVAGSLWDALGAAGAPVARAEERLEPVLAEADEAERLGVEPGAPLMRVERVAYGEDGPVEHAVAVFRGDRTRFVVEVAVDRAASADASGASARPMRDTSPP